jgi:hypothetical protein
MQNKMISTYKGVSDLVCLRPLEGMKDYILTREEAGLLYKELGETLAHLTRRAVDGDYWCCKKCNSFCSVNFDTCGLCKSPRN